MSKRNERITIDLGGHKVEVEGSGDNEYFDAERIFYNGEDISEIVDFAVSCRTSFWNVVGVKAAENFEGEIDSDSIYERLKDK